MTEVLEYCLTQLLLGPQKLIVTQLFDARTKTGLTKQFAHYRFKEQQSSILSLPPDSPLYGRGYLYPYETSWSEISPDQWQLSIARNDTRPPTHREAILLASVTEGRMPFAGSLANFKAAKARMLGREARRTSGAVHVQLRAAVANVQFTCQGGRNFVTAVDPAATVTTIF